MTILDNEELEERECEPSDGYYDASSLECMRCSLKVRGVCKIFSYINGYEDEDILVQEGARGLKEEE